MTRQAKAGRVAFFVARDAVLAPNGDSGYVMLAQNGVTPTEIVIGQFAAQSGPAAELGKRMQLGILAYFSYPVGTENDPERAVRASLDIARDIAQLATPAPAPLRVRIGIATGRVIISDMLAGGTADLRTIIGTAPNLAARLQGYPMF